MVNLGLASSVSENWWVVVLGILAKQFCLADLLIMQVMYGDHINYSIMSSCPASRLTDSLLSSLL